MGSDNLSLNNRFRMGRKNHQTLCINKKNRPLLDDLKKEAKRKKVSFTDLVFSYIRSARQSHSNVPKTEEIKKNPHIPSLDRYDKEGIGGKDVLEAAKKGLITSSEAAGVIVSAKIIVAQVYNTRLFRKLELIKSKRDTKKKNRLKWFINDVKETLTEKMIPLRYHEDFAEITSQPIDEQTKKVWDMIDSGEWEEVEQKPAPIYTCNYNLPYNPPNQ